MGTEERLCIPLPESCLEVESVALALWCPGAGEKRLGFRLRGVKSTTLASGVKFEERRWDSSLVQSPCQEGGSVALVRRRLGIGRHLEFRPCGVKSITLASSAEFGDEDGIPAFPRVRVWRVEGAALALRHWAVKDAPDSDPRGEECNSSYQGRGRGAW